jgi:hypothetical protein
MGNALIRLTEVSFAVSGCARRADCRAVRLAACAHACMGGFFSVHTSAHVVEFSFALCIDLIAISLAGVFFYIFIASGKCVICEKLKVLRVFSKVS